MHFEILVEDVSGKELLEIIVPKIIDVESHTYKIIAYKGCGRIPKNLKTTQDPSKRILLEQLPRLLGGYGKTYNKPGYNAVVIVVVDCDDRDCKEFKQDLNQVLESCNPRPNAFFRIAVEEIEAWLLGDKQALCWAYPRYNQQLYAAYDQDSIIGTWEKLADIILPDSSTELKKAAYFEIGWQKSEWAKTIGKHMNVKKNDSPSFNCFRRKLEELSNAPA
ncbi:DUF4276 family protein [Treponema sp. TIM-1]|uniref:DUF4276 family protein n=1 Tax=Treponema sp. TIM-1 TaxID=2898417 RepID=UPI003980EC9E